MLNWSKNFTQAINIVLILSALLFSTVCEAGDKEPDINLKKYCEKLSRETGKEYLLISGIGTFISTSVPMPCEFTIVDDELIPNNNENCKSQKFTYRSHLRDINTSIVNKIYYETGKNIAPERAEKLFADGDYYRVCARKMDHSDYLFGILETLTRTENKQ